MSFYEGVATDVLNFWNEEKIKLKEEMIDIIQNQRIQLSVQILPKLIVLHHKQRENWIKKFVILKLILILVRMRIKNKYHHILQKNMKKIDLKN